jgi:hypothetical protein
MSIVISLYHYKFFIIIEFKSELQNKCNINHNLKLTFLFYDLLDNNN